MSCFPSQTQKEEKNQNLLFLANSTQERCCKRKPEIKEERIGNEKNENLKYCPKVLEKNANLD